MSFLDLRRCPTVLLAIARMTPEQRELCCEEIETESDRSSAEDFILAAEVAGESWTGRGAAERIRRFADQLKEMRDVIEKDPWLRAKILKLAEARLAP